MGDATSTIDVPKEGWAGVCKNEGPDFSVEIVKVPVPEPGPDEVLIRLNATGLCMSDVHYMLADIGLPSMSTFGVQSPGHEGAGVIVKVGERVRSFKVGQRAGYKPLWDCCHICPSCKGGRENYCKGAISTGILRPGSYQQYVLSPERYTVLIPDGVDDHVAAPIMCSASTMLSSLKAANLAAGNFACFPGGGGGVGIQGVQLAVAMGLRAVVVDTGKERRELAKKYGAEHFVDFKEVENPVAEVVKLTDGGAHAVFVTAIQAYPIAMGYLGDREGGRMMCIGLGEPKKYAFTVDPTSSMLLFRNQSVMGTVISNIADIEEALDFAKRGKLQLEPTVVGLSKMPESVQKLKNGQVAGRIVVDFNLP